MTLRSVPWMYFLVSAVIVGTTTGLAVAFVLNERRANAIVEIQAAHSELELALSSVALRLASVASNLRRETDLSPSEFQRVVEETARATNQRQERAMALLPRLSGSSSESLSEYIQRWETDYTTMGYPAFELFPEYERGPLIPVVLVEPATARANVFGYNLGSSIARTRAVDRALSSGLMTVTEPVSLSQDSDPGQTSFLIIYPLFLPGERAGEEIEAAVLAAGLTPAALFSGFERLYPRTIVDVSIELGGAEALVVRLKDPAITNETMPVIQTANAISLSDIELPGASVPFEASAYYLPELRDAVIPLLALTLSSLLCLLVYLQLRTREIQSRKLERAVARKEKELREAEKINARIQRMESLGRLVGGVAHDFNNLLNVIMGNLEILSKKNTIAEAKDAIDDASTAARRGAYLTKQLLAFGRRSHLTPQKTDVREVLDDMSRMLERVLPESIRVTTETEKGLWNALVDRAGLENALLNITLNSRDAMESKGRIGVTAENIEFSETDAFGGGGESIPPGRYVCISVKDDGPGMQPDVLERAFEPFFTTKALADGSGLGLPSVLGFCRQSGGGCRIVSKPGQGTTVQMLFPIYSGDRPSVDSPDPPGDVASGDATILLAEDEAALGDLMRRHLEAAGYTVRVTRSGDEAAEILAGGECYDLLLTDVVMTGDIQGADLAGQFKRACPGSAILFVSGYPEEGLLAGDEELEEFTVLTKPVPSRKLLHHVAVALAKRKARAG